MKYPLANQPSRVLFPLLMLLVCVSGCVTEKVAENGTQVFTYELWVPLSITAGGFCAVAVGFPLLKVIRKAGVAFILGGLMVAVIVGPSMLMDSASVGERQFSLRTGLWGMTAKYDLDFEHLSNVEYVVERELTDDGDERESHYLHCEHHHGKTLKISLGNNVARAAAPHLIERLEAFGIPVKGYRPTAEYAKR